MTKIRVALSKFYFLVSPESPGVLDLLLAISRILLVVSAGLIVSYIFVDIEYVKKYWYLYAFFIVGVEDLERINFSKRSASSWKSALFFAAGVSVFELMINFSNMDELGGLFNYLLARVSPTIMHFVFASIAVLLVRKRFFWSLLAITPLHVLFNAYAGAFNLANLI